MLRLHDILISIDLLMSWMIILQCSTSNKTLD